MDSGVETRAEWQAALREAANIIVTSTPRPIKAGALASALAACANDRRYCHGDVSHEPHNDREIIVRINNQAATSLAEQLRELNLRCLANIRVEARNKDTCSRLILTPISMPRW
jgi:hypothetical protein